MGPSDASREEKLRLLKEIVLELHEGAPLESVRKRFLDLAMTVDASEIARMEQELMDGGLPESEIKKLCGLHVSVFKDALVLMGGHDLPPEHPISTFMKENRVLEGYIAGLRKTMGEIENGPSLEEKRNDVEIFLDYISDVNLHYLRKENQLFPMLERRDVTGPSHVMWALHNDIRGILKELGSGLGGMDVVPLKERIEELLVALEDMIVKEEKVLFPLSLEKLTEDDWATVRKGEDEIGYAWIAPNEGELVPRPPVVGEVTLKEGRLTVEQLDAILRALPADISFVGTDEKVAYYSSTKERIFPRSPAVIGRLVRNCHPSKSVQTVQRILDDFKAGRRDKAEFWIELHGRFVHIRYFPVFSDDGRFLGTLEFVQDATAIRALKGQKRLLD